MTAKKLAWWLVIIGALNLGLVGLNSNWDVISAVFGGYNLASRFVFGIIGLAAIYLLLTINKK